MQHSADHSSSHACAKQPVPGSISDLVARCDAGEDPHSVIARLNTRIVDCQRAGIDLPASFLQFSRTLVTACYTRSRDN